MAPSVFRDVSIWIPAVGGRASGSGLVIWLFGEGEGRREEDGADRR